MAAGLTYTPIASTTLSSAASSVTFSSISGSYTDLVIVATFTTASNSANFNLTYNSDTTSGLYSKTQLEGDGTSVLTNRTTGANNISLESNIGTNTTSPSIQIINIMNYANTTTYKTALIRQTGWYTGASGTSTRVGLWRNTNAITSVTLGNGAVNMSIGSTFTLYGILAA